MRVYELEQLRHFDDRGRANDADSKTLGDGELQAFGVGGVDVEKQRFIACWRDERLAKILDGFGEVVRDGPEYGAEGVHIGGGGVVRDGGVGESCCLGNFWLHTLT